jgi:hypothetical protein
MRTREPISGFRSCGSQQKYPIKSVSEFGGDKDILYFIVIYFSRFLSLVSKRREGRCILQPFPARLISGQKRMHANHRARLTGMSTEACLTGLLDQRERLPTHSLIHFRRRKPKVLVSEAFSIACSLVYLQECRGLVNPRHCDRSSRLINDDGICLGAQHLGHESVCKPW